MSSYRFAVWQVLTRVKIPALKPRPSDGLDGSDGVSQVFSKKVLLRIRLQAGFLLYRAFEGRFLQSKPPGLGGTPLPENRTLTSQPYKLHLRRGELGEPSEDRDVDCQGIFFHAITRHFA